MEFSALPINSIAAVCMMILKYVIAFQGSLFGQPYITKVGITIYYKDKHYNIVTRCTTLSLICIFSSNVFCCFFVFCVIRIDLIIKNSFNIVY